MPPPHTLATRAAAPFSRLTSHRLLLALLVADLLLIVLHGVHTRHWALPDTRWSIARDRGHAELLQYLKYLGSTVALWCIGRQRLRLTDTLPWLVLYALLLLDDAFQWHEGLGWRVATSLSLPSASGLRGRDWGELLTVASAGVVALPLATWLYWRTTRQARQLWNDLALLTAALLGFGVGVDALHAAWATAPLAELATVLEDGGELVCMSFTLAYLWHWLQRGGAPAWAPSQWLSRPTRARRRRNELAGPSVTPR